MPSPSTPASANSSSTHSPRSSPPNTSQSGSTSPTNNSNQSNQNDAEKADQPSPTPSSATTPRPETLRNGWDARWYLRIVGLVVAIILIYLSGRFLGGLIGRRVYSRIENGFQKLPVVSQIYPHVKQVVEVFFGGDDGDRIKFNRVVLVEYPRRGIWTVGLLTGESMKEIEKTMDNEGVTVFIPSSPTPFTGYTITVPRNEAIDLPITIDEALRFVVSGGVLVPPREMPEYISRAGQMKDGSSTKPKNDADLAQPPLSGMMGNPPHTGAERGQDDDRPETATDR